MDITDLGIADGQIEGLVSAHHSLRVEFRDWQENVWYLDFLGAIAFESISAEGEDLGDMCIEDCDDWLADASSFTQDDLSIVKCYSFFSAWNASRILRVAATECRVSAKVTE